MTLSHREIVSIAQQGSIDASQVLGTITSSVATTHLVPVTSFQATEEFEQIVDNARRGPDSMDFRAQQGVAKFNITLEGFIQPNGTTGFWIGVLLRNLLDAGAISAGAVTSPVIYNHDFQLAATPTLGFITLEHDTRISAKCRE